MNSSQIPGENFVSQTHVPTTKDSPVMIEFEVQKVQIKYKDENH